MSKTTDLSAVTELAKDATEYLLIYRDPSNGQLYGCSSLAPGNWIKMMDELKQNMSK